MWTMKLVTLLSLFPAFANAAYPDPLVWNSCGQGIMCGNLEFCQDGNTYGYRNVGDTSSSCGQYPGPLIRMKKGTTYKLTLHNKADVSTKTNVHTHGLHIVGDGDSDDVTRGVFGGECLTYTWDISADHVGGTNWYHPHYHGSTNEQTSGGAFGMLLIEDNAEEVPSWAQDEIILQMIAKPGSSTLGNGVSNDLLSIVSEKWYRLRVSVVTPGARPNDVSFVGGSCSVFKVASDGVWHSAAFDAYPGTAFELTGASRADFAIKCAAGAGDTEIKWAGKVAATLQVSMSLSDPDASTVPPGVAPSRPYALEGFDMTSLPSVPGTNMYEVALSASQINGNRWDEANPIGVLAWDQVHEWTISGSGAHPFHLHLYHMLVISPNGCGNGHKFGEFYDTISASGDCVVRFKSADFGQRMVMHCHVLSHEDNGAIVWMDVQGTDMPENNNNIPSGKCPASTPAPVTPAPVTPAPVATPAPVVTNTPAPVATAAPVNCPSTCSSNADCCSGKCNTRRGVCLGTRFLRI